MAMSLGRRIAVLVVATIMAVTMVAVGPAAWADNANHNGHHNGGGDGGGDFPAG
jgi:hypothetical protein